MVASVSAVINCPRWKLLNRDEACRPVRDAADADEDGGALPQVRH
jgi:hypothetical protein